MKQIVAIIQLKSKKLLGTSQNESKKFVFLLAIICIDGSILLPVLIY